MKQLQQLVTFLLALIGNLLGDISQAEVILGSAGFVAGLKLVATSSVPGVAHAAGIVLLILGPATVLISRVADMLISFRLALQHPSVATITGAANAAELTVRLAETEAKAAADARAAAAAAAAPPPTSVHIQ